MLLPGRLRRTTLASVLCTIGASQGTGTLELIADGGRTHRIHVTGGLVSAVEIDGPQVPLADILRSRGAIDQDTQRRSILRSLSSRRLVGEVLVTDFQISPAVIDDGLKRQLTSRLRALATLRDAEVRFRVAIRPPRGALDQPLDPASLLDADDPESPTGDVRPPPNEEAEAHRVLGIDPGALPSEIRAAYRRLARSLHPDVHPQADDRQRRLLSLRFAEVSRAYARLVA